MRYEVTVSKEAAKGTGAGVGGVVDGSKAAEPAKTEAPKADAAKPEAPKP